MSAIAWQRSAFQPGGFTNQFTLFCFSQALKSDVPMSASRFGLPSPDAMKLVEVRELPREVDAQWFDAFRGGSLRNIASHWLGGDLSALDLATQLTALLISREDTAELTHVQAAWAATKWLVERGATVVLDAQCNRFWKAADVADWPVVRPFSLSIDVNVVVEAEPTAAKAVIHTRGMQKFGRPDLVVFDVPAARWDPVGALIRSIASQLVDGVVLRAGDLVNINDEKVKLSAYAPTPQTELHLNNVGLVLSAG
ncbi:MAG: hypothetical protein QM817_28080 [Archangium sp.]